MAQSFAAPDVVNLFKEVYGEGHDLLPEDYMLQKDIPFSEKQKTGEKYVEAVILTNENGWTLGGSGYDAFELEPAIAGAVKQAEVQPHISILGSVVPFGVISRSAGAGKKAFFDATKYIVKNNLKSHGKLLEIMRLYGQSDKYLGTVSYATATYRGVALTTGSGALDFNGTSVTFTNGVNTTSKHILFAPGQWAAGIWVGTEGAVIQQIATATGTVVAEGNLVSIDVEQGIIEVDFTPVAATAADSHALCFKGMASQKESIGVQKILSTEGSLFGISNTQYNLWKGNQYNVGSAKLKLEEVQNAVAQAVNRGGLDSDLKLYVNPRTLAKMITTEAGLREYDGSYKVSEGENGFESIKFHAQNGVVQIVAHRMVKEGDGFGMCLKEWSRSGSAEISFKVPGLDSRDLIYPLENQAAYAFRSYSDQYIFCNGPSKSIYFHSINDESST
jgi:hypothetical protein